MGEGWQFGDIMSAGQGGITTIQQGTVIDTAAPLILSFSVEEADMEVQTQFNFYFTGHLFEKDISAGGGVDGLSVHRQNGMERPRGNS